MIGLTVLAGATIAGMLALMQTSNDIYIKSMKVKAEMNMKTAQEIRKQSAELLQARATYYKTYGKYPSSIDELIAKGMLRANYKTTVLSKDITVDSLGNVQVATNNTVANAYMGARAKKLNDIKAKYHVATVATAPVATSTVIDSSAGTIVATTTDTTATSTDDSTSSSADTATSDSTDMTSSDDVMLNKSVF